MHGRPAPQLDPRTIRELALLEDAEPGVLRLLFEEFITDGELRLESMGAAGPRELEAVRLEAHRLKGASGAVGAVEVMRLCHIIEQDAGAGVWSEERYGQLRVAFALAEVRLREFLAGL